ncbi:OmpL47-type beta-barrel domain-containing protein [Paenibacillus sp. NPDC093718]|uniref:OmpL47-type beta-barrel domain-containing protein n=1 Tax=Paenibacillus sp. NPDC093718 TaxID=3390601 RepID=UPI003CFCA007
MKFMRKLIGIFVALLLVFNGLIVHIPKSNAAAKVINMVSNGGSYEKTFFGNYGGAGGGGMADGGSGKPGGQYWFAKNRYLDIGYPVSSSQYTLQELISNYDGEYTQYVSLDGVTWHQTYPSITKKDQWVEQTNIPIPSFRYIKATNINAWALDYFAIRLVPISKNIPTLSINTNGDKIISTLSGRNILTISGVVNDLDGDDVTVSATIGGIKKSSKIDTFISKDWTLSWTAAELSEGIYRDVAITADDGINGSDTKIYSGVISIDKTAPNSPSFLANTNWSSNDVPISITPGTDAIGVSHVEYKIGNGNYQRYSSPLTITSEGQNVVTARTIDLAGYTSPEKSITIKIDKTPPSVPEITISPSNLSNSTLHVEARPGSDLLSGVNRVEYKVGNSNWTEYTSSLNYVDEGVYTLSFRTIDNAGNISKEINANPSIDKTKPTTPTIAVSPNGWTEQNVEITITPGVDPSGISRTEFQLDMGSWQPYSAPLSISKEGITIIKARSIDNAGNISDETQAEAKIVKSPPTAPIITLQTGSWSKNPVNFNISGSTGHGDLNYEYKVDDGEFQEGDTGQVIKEGETIITARAVNGFGQKSPEATSTIRIDKSGPEIIVTPDGRDWSTDTVPVNIAVIDSLSGVQPSGVYYKVTNTATEPTDWEVFNGSVIELSNEGQWFVHVKAMDNVGNTSIYSSKPIKIQDSPVEPLNVRPSQIHNNQVTIQWDLPTGNVYTDGYEYEVRNTVTGATYQTTYPVSSITDNGVLGGRTYEYIVSVKNHVGQTQAQSIAVLTKPDAPEQLQVQKVDRDYSKAYLTFDPAVGADSYRVIVRDNGGGTLIDEVIYSENYIINGLPSGTVINITVYGINASGQGPGNSISYLSLPDTPEGFSSASIEENAITLKWHTVTSATYYDLERFTDLIYEGPEPEFKDTGLESGSVYDFRVAAANETGPGEYAELKDLITLPSKPSHAEIVGATENSVTMQWASVQGAESYIVETSRGDREIVNTTHYTFQGLNPGQEYEFTVTAQNRSGQGKSVHLTAVTIPEEPSDVQVRNIEETTAEIIWNLTTGADKYLVQIDGKDYEVSGNSLQLNGLTGSKSYDFTVSAGNGSGFGAVAIGQFITKPHPPSNVKVVSLGKNEIMLSWEKDETAGRYQAQIVGSSDSLDLIGPDVTIRNLKPGASYDIDIWTHNVSGQSKPTRVTFTTKTQAVVPDSIVVTVEENQVTIEFSPVENAKEHVLLDENGIEVWRGIEGPITISPVTTGKHYDFTLVAENEQGRPSDPSEIHFITIPGIPTGIVIEQITDERVVFDLIKANKKGADSLVVFRDGKEVGEIKSSEDKYTDKDLDAGKNYVYEFKARNKYGTSSKSVHIDVLTVPAIPSGIKIMNVTETSVSFDLSKAIVGTADYLNISRNGEDIAQVAIDGKGFTDKGLKAGTRYTYEFKAENESGISRGVVLETETKKTLISSGGGTGGDSGNSGIPEKTPNPTLEKPTSIEVDPDETVEVKTENENSSSGFRDIENSYAKVYINELANRGIVKGVSETKFEPVRPITRAEFVSMIVRALDLQRTFDKEMDFNDINLNAWYVKELQAAWDNDVAHGFSATVFRPNDLINREQASKMLGNVLQAKSESNNPVFVDEERIAVWAKNEVLGLSEKQLITGYPDGSFRPKANLTRAESATLIYRTIMSSSNQ